MQRWPVLGISLLLVGLTAAGASVAGASETSIGTVKEVDGTAFIVSDGARRSAVLAEPVFQNDTLETGADGALGVTFIDGSRLAIGPETSLTVDEYVFEPEDEKGAFISRLARGTLLYVSGLIAKLSPEATAVETPVGTIGIRGTKLMVELVWEAQ